MDTDSTAGPATAGPAASVGRRGQLLLLRHGETVWSSAGRHTSRTDVPLTPRGEAQARALAPRLRGLDIALVLTSPMTRAAHTAKLVGLDAVPEPDLHEWDYGGYEGLTTATIRETVPGWTVWSHPVPGGETDEQVGARADRVLARAGAAMERGDVVLIAHGHFLRVVTARYLGLPVDGGRLFALDPARPCLLGTEHGNPVIRAWNLGTELVD
jgi:probable phosphoglycerate mutase